MTNKYNSPLAEPLLIVISYCPIIKIINRKNQMGYQHKTYPAIIVIKNLGGECLRDTNLCI